MALLILGLAIWAGVHAFTSLARPQRAALIDRFGEAGYKIGYSLLLVLAIVLMVRGWGQADFTPLWIAPLWLHHVVALLMLPAFILFFCGRAPNNIRRYIRHPQLTGVKLWAALHLIVNGDAPSIVLFGGLLAWAVMEVILINRREGPYTPPEPAPLSKALIAPAVGTAAWLLFLLWLHAWLFNVSPIAV